MTRTGAKCVRFVRKLRATDGGENGAAYLLGGHAARKASFPDAELPELVRVTGSTRHSQSDTGARAVLRGLDNKKKRKKRKKE